VTIKEEEGLTNSEEVPMEEGRDIMMASNKESNNDDKTATLKRMTLLRS